MAPCVMHTPQGGRVRTLSCAITRSCWFMLYLPSEQCWPNMFHCYCFNADSLHVFFAIDYLRRLGWNSICTQSSSGKIYYLIYKIVKFNVFFVESVRLKFFYYFSITFCQFDTVLLNQFWISLTRWIPSNASAHFSLPEYWNRLNFSGQNIFNSRKNVPTCPTCLEELLVINWFTSNDYYIKIGCHPAQNRWPMTRLVIPRKFESLSNLSEIPRPSPRPNKLAH